MGHRQTKRRYRKRRKNNRADGNKSTKNVNSNIQPEDKISELKCDNSKTQVNRPASLCSQNINMQPDQNTEKMNEKKGMQSDLVASEQSIKTFDNESEQSIKTDRSLTIGQLGISSLLRLDLKLMNTPVKAAVDTAAEVSI